MRLRLIRHTTLAIEYNGHNLLVDPMLDDAKLGGRCRIRRTSERIRWSDCRSRRRGLVDDVEAVLVTHTHSDHWDGTAVELIRKNLPLFGQAEDEDKSGSKGFQMFSR